jgi:hypothetical protein
MPPPNKNGFLREKRKNIGKGLSAKVTKDNIY